MRTLRLAVGLTLAACGSRTANVAQTTPVADRVQESPVPSTVDLPDAKNALPLSNEPLPVVWVTAGKIYRDGVLLADAGEIVPKGRVQRVDALFQMMKSLRELWKAENSDKQFPGTVLVAFDKATPGLVVKSVFQTCGLAGFPYSQFAVRMSGGKIGRLNVRADAWEPLDPTGIGVEHPPHEAKLLVGVQSSKYVLEWRKGWDQLSRTETASLADMSNQIGDGWAKNGAHHDKGDSASDQAIVFLPDELDYAGMIEVIDAIEATTRELSGGRGSERLPVMKVTLRTSSEMIRWQPHRPGKQ